jgi:hypothetical protein
MRVKLGHSSAPVLNSLWVLFAESDNEGTILSGGCNDPWRWLSGLFVAKHFLLGLKSVCNSKLPLI